AFNGVTVKLQGTKTDQLTVAVHGIAINVGDQCGLGVDRRQTAHRQYSCSQHSRTKSGKCVQRHNCCFPFCITQVETIRCGHSVAPSSSSVHSQNLTISYPY